MFTNQTGGISGNLPDLISHLEDLYRQEIDKPVGLSIDATRFIDFAKKYLTQNRPTEVFAVDNNYGVMLTNGFRMKISPEALLVMQATGDMANPDTSISITRPR